MAVRGIAVGIGHAEDLGGGEVRTYVSVAEGSSKNCAAVVLDRSGGGAPVGVI